MALNGTCVACVAAWLLQVCLVASASAAAAPDDWPQFRGPSGDGVSAAKDPPLTWSESQNILWKVPLPGRGQSSPVVLGDRIWLTTAIEQGLRPTKLGPEDAQIADHVSLAAVCLDRRDGTCLGQVIIFEIDKPPLVHALNSYATPTPVVEPRRLYCDFGAMGTGAVDTETRKVLWTERLPVDHLVGPGSSPIVYKDLLILVRDGCDAQFVAALDKNTGKVAWKTDRPPIQARSDMRKAFSTPLIIDAGGATQMVAVGAHWVVSYDPATGRQIWHVRHGKGYSLAPRPVYGNGMVYIDTGCEVAQLWAIRVDGQGDVTDTHVAWKATENVPILSSPLLVGKELYFTNDTGAVSCLDALTGQLLWRGRAPGMQMASPVYAAGRLYFFGRDGRTTVLRAGRQLEKLAENRLEGLVSASPAFAGNTILLRTDTHLYCIGNKATAAP